MKKFLPIFLLFTSLLGHAAEKKDKEMNSPRQEEGKELTPPQQEEEQKVQDLHPQHVGQHHLDEQIPDQIAMPARLVQSAKKNMPGAICKR